MIKLLIYALHLKGFIQRTQILIMISLIYILIIFFVCLIGYQLFLAFSKKSLIEGMTEGEEGEEGGEGGEEGGSRGDDRGANRFSARGGAWQARQAPGEDENQRAPGALVRERSRMQGLQRRRERRSRQAGCCVCVQSHQVA